jgi:hypothetical protein
MEIIKQREGKEDGLTWGEIQKMKYTWRVAQELLRMFTPVFGAFRKTLKDTNYQGYNIPKGWQVMFLPKVLNYNCGQFLILWIITVQRIEPQSHLHCDCGDVNIFDLKYRL